MALLDVGPFLEGVSNLQGKLEDAITKNRLLLEAVEGSNLHSKYAEIVEAYPILRSLKARLVAAQGPNKSLSTELVQFKLEMESFVDGIFNSHDSLSKIRRNSLRHAKELEGDRDKLWYERGELAAERKRLDLEREELNVLRMVMEKTLDEEKRKLNRVERTVHLVQTSVGNKIGENKENSTLKTTLTESCDAECQTKLETSLDYRERIYENEQDSVTWNHVECQTEPIGNLQVAHQSQNMKRGDTVEYCKSFADNGVNEDTMQTDRHRFLSSRSHRTCFRTEVTGPRQRVFTEPVSRARAKLLAKQEHAFKNYKILVDELCKTREDNQSLKLENSTLAKRANGIYSELLYIKKQLTVNIADRDELQKKLRKCKEQIHRLEDTLKKQAYGLVYNKKQQRQFEEEIKWSQIFAVPVNGPSSRRRNFPS